MFHSMTRVSLFAVALALAPRAQDGVTNLIPKDSKFAVYVDLQAAIDFVGRDLLEKAIAQQVSESGKMRLRQDWSARLEKDWGMDPLRDLKGILMFGDELEGETPALVLLASEKVDATLEKFYEMGALEREEHDGATYARIAPAKIAAAFTGEETDDDETEGFLHVKKLRGGMRALMFGESLRTLAPMVQALGDGRGQQGRGQKGRAGLALAPRENCIAYVEVADAFRDLMESTPASRISNKTKRLTLQLCGGQDALDVVAALETETEKDAKQVAAVLNGLKALLGLVEAGEEVPEELMEAVSSARAEADGNQVSLRIEVPRSALDQVRGAIEAELGGRRAKARSARSEREDDEDEVEAEEKPAKPAKRRGTIR
jgi:hypothetical protein